MNLIQISFFCEVVKEWILHQDENLFLIWVHASKLDSKCFTPKSLDTCIQVWVSYRTSSKKHFFGEMGNYIGIFKAKDCFTKQ